MLTLLKNANLTVAFLLDLCVPVALSYWGFQAGQGMIAKRPYHSRGGSGAEWSGDPCCRPCGSGGRPCGSSGRPSRSGVLTPSM